MGTFIAAASGSRSTRREYLLTSGRRRGVAGTRLGTHTASFFPQPWTDPEGEDERLRAVVFVTEDTPKGTARSHQEYASPLLVLSGEEYARIPFADLHERLCDALRAGRPRVVGEYFAPGGTITILFEDGSRRDVTTDT